MGREVDVRPSGITGNLDSIGQCGGGGMGPAGTTVLWVVLLANVGQVVDTISISPVEIFG